MPDPTPRDPLDVLRSARDSVRKMQELAGKLTVPPSQRRALIDGIARMTMPGEQLEAMVELADAFGPPHTQIEHIRDTLDAQREMLESMLEDLERIEASVDRLADASQQIAAMQTPFRLMLERFQSSDSAGGDDEAHQPDED